MQEVSESNYFFKLSKYQDEIKKLIETETLKKEPCLVLRANNPAQNLFSMVDGDTLIKNIIGELKNVAARKGIKNTVVTMLEGSDSNRDEIKDYYKKHYSEQMISKIVPDNEDPTKFIDKRAKGNAVWPTIVVCLVIFGSLITSAVTQNWLIVAFCAGPMITNFLEDVIFPPR